MRGISNETAIGISLEIAVIFLHRLHLRDPRIVFGVFELGVFLIADRIARGEWAETIFHSERRRKKRIRVGVAAAIVFAFFGWWVVRLPVEAVEAKEGNAFQNEGQSVHALPEAKPNPAYPCLTRKLHPRKPLHATDRARASEKILGEEQKRSHLSEFANEASFP